jgi:hypothetical protein
VVVGGILISAANDDPVYYVDGARPMGKVDGHGCVPYSEERQDLSICGPLPEDFDPRPKPYLTEEICAAAERWLDEARE